MGLLYSFKSLNMLVNFWPGGDEFNQPTLLQESSGLLTNRLFTHRRSLLYLLYISFSELLSAVGIKFFVITLDSSVWAMLLSRCGSFMRFLAKISFLTSYILLPGQVNSLNSSIGSFLSCGASPLNHLVKIAILASGTVMKKKL